jgi:nucleoside-diphosphate-sugar epimerase
MSALHVVLGAGPLGSAVARSLTDRGERVRLVSRTGRHPHPIEPGRPAEPLDDGIEIVAADVSTPEGAADAVRGASVVYQCTQPAYHRWVQEFPALQRGILDAAAATGADLVLADNLYAYGDHDGGLMVDDSLELAETRKGTVRLAMARDGLDAHRAGRLRVAVTRPSNYFGPGYALTGTTVFAKAAVGKPMQLLGRGDQPHSMSYVPDAGAAMAAIGTSDHGWGRVWITAIQPPLTQQEFAQRVWTIAGQVGVAKTTYIGPAMLRLAGLFSPTIREAIEMSYEYMRPFVASSAQFESAFGMAPTPLDDAIAQTLRAHAPASVTVG